METNIKIDVIIEDGCVEVVGFEIPVCMDRDDLQCVFMDIISNLNDYNEE